MSNGVTGEGVPGEKNTIAIIGGGVAGLASAALLAKSGYDVHLYEQGEQFGGRAGLWTEGGFRFDTGPSWFLMREVFEHFFDLLGTSLADEVPLQRLDPAYSVFFERGEALQIHADPVRNVDTFESAEPGAGAQLLRYLASAQHTYDMAVQRFLYTSFASPAAMAQPALLRHLPTLAKLLGQSLQSRVARDFTDPRLRQILGFPAVFLGTSPDRAPSMYHLMSALDLTGGVYYPAGGMYSLVQALERCARAAGATLHAGARVSKVNTAKGGRGRKNQVTGLTVSTNGTTHEVRADVVVGATDVSHVEGMLKDGTGRGERHWDRQDPGPGGVLAMLGVRGRVPELAHHNLFFTDDWTSNFEAIFGDDARVPDPASVYVCAPSRTDPTCAPPDHENLFVLIPVPADTTIGAGGIDGHGAPAVEAAVDRAITQVAAWAGVPDLADRIVVRKTVGPADFATNFSARSGSMLGPAHTLFQSAMWRTANASPAVNGLYYAGAATVPGVGLPMCLISAEVLLKRLRGDTSSGPLAGLTQVASSR